MDNSLIVGQMDISLISDDELFERLSALGADVGPVLPTTRRVYERKLARILRGDDSNWLEAASGDSLENSYHDEQESDSPKLMRRQEQPLLDYTSNTEQVRQRPTPQPQRTVDFNASRNFRNVASPRPPIRDNDPFSSSSSMHRSFASEIVEQAIPTGPEAQSERSYSGLIKLILAVIFLIILAFAVIQSMESNPMLQEVGHSPTEKLLEE